MSRVGNEHVKETEIIMRNTLLLRAIEEAITVNLSIDSRYELPSNSLNNRVEPI